MQVNQNSKPNFPEGYPQRCNRYPSAGMKHECVALKELMCEKYPECVCKFFRDHKEDLFQDRYSTHKNDMEEKYWAMVNEKEQSDRKHKKKDGGESIPPIEVAVEGLEPQIVKSKKPAMPNVKVTSVEASF